MISTTEHNSDLPKVSKRASWIIINNKRKETKISEAKSKR